MNNLLLKPVCGITQGAWKGDYGMLHSIRNAFLTVTAEEEGAQLQSILGADGTEYLWQGDPKYWSDRALNIFPYVARLTGGRYRMDGQEYAMDIHGIAPYRRFSLKEKTETSMVLTLASDAQTRKSYPRDFRFSIGYALKADTLEITFTVENRDEKTMYFGLGGHPGFPVPLTPGKKFEDYRLRFPETCEPRRVGFTKDCFLDGTDAPFPLQEGRLLPLNHSLFDDDAIVLKDMARQVTLEADSGPSITVTFPQMPYLGIWHWPRTDAPYVCMEPWSSLPSVQDQVAIFEQQQDLISLAPGKTYHSRWSIQIHAGR